MVMGLTIVAFVIASAFIFACLFLKTDLKGLKSRVMALD